MMNDASLHAAVPGAIAHKLRLVRSWKRWVQLATAALLALVVLLAAMGVAMFVDWLSTLYDSRWRYVLTNAALSVAALTSLGWLLVAWRRGMPWSRVAGDVDREFPELEERWTTMTRLAPASVGDPHVVHPAMFRRVAAEATRWEPHVDPQQIVSLSPLIRTMLCFTALTLVLGVAVIFDARQTMVLMRRFWSPGSSISATELVDVPGSTVVGRGEPLLLAANLRGKPVDRATLFVNSAEDERKISLVAQGSDPIAFSHNVRSVEKPFTYRFRAGDGQTEWFEVSVADRPEIEKLEMTITPPKYTKREAKTFDRLPRRVSAIEDSVLELAVRPKIAVERIELLSRDKQIAVLMPGEDGWYRWRTELKANVAFAPLLTESHGLTNRQSPRCEIEVVKDKPPAVKVLTPDDQVAVRPGDKIGITFAAQDDVGIGSAELVVYGANDENGQPTPLATIPIDLGEQAGERTVQGQAELDLSKFQVNDGMELSYQVRVREDRGETGGERMASAAPNGATNQATASARSADPPAAAMANSTAPESAPQNAVPQTGSPKNETPGSNSPASGAQNPERVAANNVDKSAGEPKAPAAGMPAAAGVQAGEKLAAAPGKEPAKTQAAGGAKESAPAAGAQAKEQPAVPEARLAESQRRGLTTGDAKNESMSESPANNQTPPANQMAGGEKKPGNAPQGKNAQPNAGGKPSPSASAASQSPAGTPSAAKPSSGEPSQSDPPPGDSMSRRSLDVAQSSSSDRMRLKVDEWAGSFSGQQRQKLEVAIAPRLAALDEALAKAERTAQGVISAIADGGEWRAAHEREITSAEESTESGQKVIDELARLTKDTPYAFIGLQVSDVGLAHVEPARSGFWTALESDGDGRLASIRDSHQHLVRARQLVAELRGQFERSKKEFQLAEAVERVKKMYQVYVENSMKLLPTSESEKDRYRRKMAEFDLDEEYLKRLQEVMKMREELRAELARILADDPRLLRRLMDSIRNRSENLRSELAVLTADQQEFNREVRAWSETSEADRPKIAQLLLMRQLRKSNTIATMAGELQDRYQAWLPLDRKSKDGNLATATEHVQQLATAANGLSGQVREYIADATAPKLAVPADAAPTDGAAGAGESDVGEAKPQAEAAPVESSVPTVEALVAEGQRVYETAVRAETTLRQLSASEGDPEIAAFAANRLADSRKIIAASSAWVRQVRAHQASKYSRAAEVEQYRLAMKTEELAGKLGTLEQSIAGALERTDGSLPEPIAVKAREFMAALDKEASPNQLAAVYALHTDDMPRATERQLLAGGALEKAERLYDEMMKLAIVEMDKLPVQDPIANLLDDPTLDELLARLEQEQAMEQLLGIPPRPSNLRVVDDWLNPNGAMATAMRSRAWMQQQLRREDERARRQLDEAYRRAVARALKETKPKTKIAVPKRTTLSDWNRLVSELKDDVGQGRDKAPPEQYRRAIEQYFSQISREVAEEEKPAP